MAVQLVEHLAADWEPSKYKDEYRENIMEVIEAKMKGEKIEVPAEKRERPSNVVDLMARLQQSLEAAKGAGRRQKAEGTAKGGRRKAGRKKASKKRAKVA